MNTEIIIFASLGLIRLLMKDKTPPAVGKIEDVNFKGGGRIDAYWRRKLIRGEFKVHPMRTIGRQVDSFQDYELIPEVAVKHFNLHGIEFGNWMNQQDRLDALFATMTSLKDLAKVIGIPMKKIGRKRLSIAMGARGSSGAKAHYEPRSTWTINLTKYNGKNSLAHEYGHFLDNYLASRYYKSGYLSGGHSLSKRPDPEILARGRGLQYHMERVFQILYWEGDGSPTKFYEDQMKRTPYFQSRVEVWARTFEAYVFLKMNYRDITNDWLTKRKPPLEWPPLDLVDKAFKHIDKIVKAAYK